MASNRSRLRSAFWRSRSAALRCAADSFAERDPVSFTMTVACGAGVGRGTGVERTDWVEFSATTIPTVPVYTAFGDAGIETHGGADLGVGVGSETIWRSPKSFGLFLLGVVR